MKTAVNTSNLEDAVRNVLASLIADGELSSVAKSGASIPSNIIVREDNSGGKEGTPVNEEVYVDEERNSLDLDLIGKKTISTLNHSSSYEEENLRLRFEVEDYKSKVSAMEEKIDCQRMELAKLNRKVMETTVSKSKSDEMMDMVARKCDDLKNIDAYKSKISDMERTIMRQREELAKLNKKVTQNQINKSKYDDMMAMVARKCDEIKHVEAYTSKMSEMEQTIMRQREELAKLNKKMLENQMYKSDNEKMMAQVVDKFEELKQIDSYKSKISDMEQTIMRQRDELAKLNKKMFENQVSKSKNDGMMAQVAGKYDEFKHIEEYKSKIVQMEQKIIQQRKELAALNKKKVSDKYTYICDDKVSKWDQFETLVTKSEMEKKIDRQRKELAKLNKKVMGNRL